MSQVVISRYGRAASEQLAAAIATAKATSSGGSLAPVTVVVPSNFAGLVARRLLGSGQLGGTGTGRGIANVNFLTPFRLAELLAVGQLQGKRPLTNPVLGAAVRQALRDNPRHFVSVRDHQATEQAIAAAVGELSNVSVQGLQAIQDMGGFAGSVIELHRSVVGRLRDFHDEAELARAATHRDDLVDALAPFGPIIWHLPGVTSAPLGLFLRAVLQAVPSTVIVGLSGVPEADEQVRRSLTLAQVELPAETVADAPPLAGHVVSVTDADEEVRQVIRQVVELVDGGVPLDRIGVFHPVPDPYVRMLEQHFAAAGIAANGPSRRRLSESIAGRVLLSALALPSERWRRDRVMALLSTAPIRHGDEVARPTSWDAVSRDAGVVLDLRDWHAKLASYLERLNRQHDEAVESGQTRRLTAIERGIADASSLQSFVVGLAEHVAAVDAADSWEARGDAAKALLRDLLGPPHHHGWWPEAEQEAFDQVEAGLERLAALDEIDPDPSTVVFARALSTELSVARGRSGRFGQGLVYGPLASAAGHDLDAVFILGCAEGILPAPRREDVLLSDDARRATGMDLPTRLGQLHEQHRLFLAALAAAPAERRWRFFPRGDLRSSRRSRPSRWLLPSATEIAGKPLFATDFEHETPPGLTEIASHAEAIASTEHPASLDERDLAEVLTFVRNDGDAVEHPAAEAVELGLRLQRARAGGDFTVFDGNLAGQRLPTTDERPQSASRLESWATCGFRYFLGHVLDLSDRDDPERTIELSALDRRLGHARNSREVPAGHRRRRTARPE